MLKKYKISFLVLAFIASATYAQPNRTYETNPDKKRTNIWYFGEYAGTNLNLKPPSKLLDSKMYALEGSATISDTAGNLLLYTDGITVWNRFHDTIAVGLLGHESSTQSATICKHPDNDSLYYIFTTPFVLDFGGLHYTLVNIYSNGGKGKVIKKNILLYSSSAEKLTSVYHQNNRDLWVIGHTYIDNIFMSYLIKENGLINCPVLSPAGTILNYNINFRPNCEGYLKASHNSRFIANTLLDSKKVEIFTFSNNNGKINFYKSIKLNFQPYGLEFSENDSNLIITGFTSDTNYICIYGISNNTIRLIKKFKMGNVIQSVQLSGNGLIYLTYHDSTYLTAIDNPNYYSISGINPVKKDSTFNRINYGLPNYIQSYFYTPSIDFAYNYDCISNSIKFEGRDTFYSTTHYWQIKKGNKPVEASYSKKNISHSFSDTGNYQIRYIAVNGNRNDTIIKTISIYPKIAKQFLGKDTTYAVGSTISKQLKAPNGMHCQLWFNDSSGLSSYTADTTGVFICKAISQSFCEVIDTITISECINSLAIPSIYRSKDSLYTYSQLADSFVWYKNNIQYSITKQPFIKLNDTGTYRVEAAKKGHCNRSSATQNVNKLGIRYMTLLEAGISIYPNPVSDILNIIFQQQGDYQITLFNPFGKTIYSLHTATNGSINLCSLPAGVYLVQINNKTLTFNSVILKE
jgi:hypothetical protein